MCGGDISVIEFIAVSAECVLYLAIICLNLLY